MIGLLTDLIDILEDGDKITDDFLGLFKKVLKDLKDGVNDVFNNMVLVYLAGKLGIKHGDNVKIKPKDAQEAKEWVKQFMGV